MLDAPGSLLKVLHQRDKSIRCFLDATAVITCVRVTLPVVYKSGARVFVCPQKQPHAHAPSSSTPFLPSCKKKTSQQKTISSRRTKKSGIDIFICSGGGTDVVNDNFYDDVSRFPHQFFRAQINVVLGKNLLFTFLWTKSLFSERYKYCRHNLCMEGFELK